MKVQQRRRLTDLYARGEYVELTDGSYVTDPDGNKTPSVPIVLWIRKMTPVEAETAYLKASARRAAVVSGSKSDPPSDLYVSLQSEISKLTKDDLVGWAVSGDMVNRGPVIEARLAAEEEWAEERYLESLKERVTDPDFAEKGDDDPEVVRVRSELARFQTSVEAETAKERERLSRDYGNDSEAELRDRILADMLGGQGDAAWLAEFQRCQVWLCTYDGENKKQRYFSDRAEVDQLQNETLGEILTVIDRLHVGDVEGKDSQQTADSSPQ